MTETTGMVCGPFDKADWYTMLKLRMAKAFEQKLKQNNPDLYTESEAIVSKKYKKYIRRTAA